MKKVFIFLLSLCATLLFPQFISTKSLDFSNSIFSIFFFVLLFLFLNYAYKQNFDIRMKKLTHILGLLFSGMTAFGFSLGNNGKVNYTNIWLILSIITFTHIYAVLLCVFWTCLKKAELKLSGDCKTPLGKKIDCVFSFVLEKQWLITILILICWIPCYISTYPGNFIYDATKEFEQSTNGYLQDFPLLHSLIITKLLSLSFKLTGSHNVGIAIYTIIQMLLISTLFAHILHTLKKQGLNNILLGVLSLYYALFPSIHLLVTCTVRDVMFSALLTYSIFLFYQMSKDFSSFMTDVKKSVYSALIFVLTLLSRNNNTGFILPAIIILLSVVFIIISKKKRIKLVGSISFATTAIIGFICINILLTSLCQPLTPAKTTSSLSFLTQSLARAYTLNKDEWTSEEKAEFNKYFYTSQLEYVPENADPTKNFTKFSKDEMGPFLKFWIKMGAKYPGCYLDGILATNRQMWFPGCVVDGYNERGLYEDYEKCYFYFNDQIASPGTHKHYLPFIHKFYKNIGLNISFEKIPVISLLFSIGFHFWIILNAIFYILYRKQKGLILPILIILVYVIISAFVPLVLLRYFAAVFFAFPLMVCYTLQPEMCSKKDNNLQRSNSCITQHF